MRQGVSLASLGELLEVAAAASCTIQKNLRPAALNDIQAGEKIRKSIMLPIEAHRYPWEHSILLSLLSRMQFDSRRARF
jgi:hypothetical protein